MKLIYLAGPYTGPTWSAIENHIKEAEKVAIQLWNAGWAVICPHLNTAHFEKYESIAGINHRTWIEGDLEILRRCDAIIMMQGWATSQGANVEYETALEKKIPIFFEAEGIPSPEPIKPPDLSKCPKCGGPADNGHDRCLPPNPYVCTKCDGITEDDYKNI